MGDKQIFCHYDMSCFVSDSPVSLHRAFTHIIGWSHQYTKQDSQTVLYSIYCILC